MDIAKQLQERGWYLSQKGIEECTEGERIATVDNIIKKALNLDFHDIGDKALPDIVKDKLDSVCGPYVVQILKVRNVSAPKSNENSQVAPVLLRVYFTDGLGSCSALQWGNWNSITIETPPGTKVLLKAGQLRCQSGFLLLGQSQFTVLGGCVEHLVEKWKLSQFSRFKRVNTSGNGPPPWVPFGQKINYTSEKDLKGKFKSLNIGEKGSEDAFDQQRKATIAEIARNKEGKQKVFGKGKKVDDFQNSENPYQRRNYRQFNKDENVGDNTDRKFTKELPVNRPPLNQDKYHRKDRNDERRDRNEEPNQSDPSAPSTLYDFLHKKLTVNDVPSNNSSDNANNVRSAHLSSVPERQKRPNYPYNEGRQYGDSRNQPRGGGYPRNRSSRESGPPMYRQQQYETPPWQHKQQASNFNQRGSASSRTYGSNYQGRGSGRNKTSEEQMFNSTWKLKPGDTVLAKYWEDKQFYRAFVYAVSANGQTCVVNFIDYGNHEEVLVEDVHPIPPEDFDVHTLSKAKNDFRSYASNKAVKGFMASEDVPEDQRKEKQYQPPF